MSGSRSVAGIDSTLMAKEFRKQKNTKKKPLRSKAEKRAAKLEQKKNRK